MFHLGHLKPKRLETIIDSLIFMNKNKNRMVVKSGYRQIMNHNSNEPLSPINTAKSFNQSLLINLTSSQPLFQINLGPAAPKSLKLQSLQDH